MAKPFRDKPPKATATTTQASKKPRVIPASEILRVSPTRTKGPRVAADPSTLVSKPSKPPSAFSSFLNRCRQRYATLPASVRGTARALRFIAPALPIGIFFSEHVLQIMWVRGPSMTPYLNENYAETHTESDMVLVNMLPWGTGWPWSRTRNLERGMVVTFRSPANPSHIAIKRVIGLPGDRITTREPCLKPSCIVPYNHVWLEGDADDPRKSLDSNTYGPVSMSMITGSVIAVLYPRMRQLRWWDWDNPFHKQLDADTQKEVGEGYRASVRSRVVKDAVKIETPMFN